MLLGFNMLLWASQSRRSISRCSPRSRQPAMTASSCRSSEAQPEDYVQVGRELKNSGLRATAVCVIPDKEHDCTSCDPQGRATPASPISNGRSIVSRRPAARCCAGRSTSRSASSPATRRPTEERAGIVEVHKEAARYAARRPRSSSPSSRSTASSATRSTRSRDAADDRAPGRTSRTTAFSTTPSTPTSRRRIRSA